MVSLLDPSQINGDIDTMPIELPASLVEELKVWQQAFSTSYGKPMSYADMIRSMLDGLEVSEPGVFRELETMLEAHPELLERMGDRERWNSLA